jgi:hypothetical protein
MRHCTKPDGALGGCRNKHSEIFWCEDEIVVINQPKISLDYQPFWRYQ